jgi:nicotinamide-nucleotide amidase
VAVAVQNQIKTFFDEHRLWLAVAESLTAGNIQASISSVSGSSTFFCGGITTYNIHQKVRLLGVDREHAASVNCVSLKVAEQMSVGAASLFTSDVAIATTGYAEPAPDQDVKEPYLHYAIFSAPRNEIVVVGTLESAEASRQSVQVDLANQVVVELAKSLDALKPHGWLSEPI